MNRTSRSASNEDKLVQSCVARVTDSLQNQLKEIVKEALSAIKQEQQLKIDSLRPLSHGRHLSYDSMFALDQMEPFTRSRSRRLSR